MSTDQIAADIAREGSIRRLANELRVERLLENGPEQRRLLKLLADKVDERRPDVVAAMEKARGLHP